MKKKAGEITYQTFENICTAADAAVNEKREPIGTLRAGPQGARHVKERIKGSG